MSERNTSTTVSLMAHVCNPVDKTKLSCSAIKRFFLFFFKKSRKQKKPRVYKSTYVVRVYTRRTPHGNAIVIVRQSESLSLYNLTGNLRPRGRLSTTSHTLHFTPGGGGTPRKIG